MAEILPFTGNTILEEDPEIILEKAKKWEMAECVIVGTDSDGELILGGSISDSGKIMLLLEAAKSQVIRTVFD